MLARVSGGICSEGVLAKWPQLKQTWARLFWGASCKGHSGEVARTEAGTSQESLEHSVPRVP